MHDSTVTDADDYAELFELATTRLTRKSVTFSTSTRDKHTNVLALFLSGKSYAVRQAWPAPVSSRRTRRQRCSGSVLGPLLLAVYCSPVADVKQSRCAVVN